MTTDRRAFLKTTGTALSAAALGGCASGDSPRAGNGGAGGLDPALLRGVAVLVLPGELGDVAREAAVVGFERWAAAYEPVAELNHGYGTSEIRYGPADPVPGWGAQLRALEVEATKRYGVGWLALGDARAEEILRRQVDDEGTGIPSPLRARHVAVALLAWWLESPDATDRCYGVRIGPQTCRGIASAPAEPETLAADRAADPPPEART